MTTPVLTPPPTPPPVVRPPRPAAPTELALRALGAGIVAAALVVGHDTGAGVVAAVVVALACLPAARLATPVGAVFATTAAGLVLVALLRDADWVVGLCLVAALVTWSVLLSDGKIWQAAALGAFAVPMAWFPAVPWLGRSLTRATAGRRAEAAPALRGVAVAVLLLAAFGGLFVTADAAFRELLGRLALPPPGPLLPGRVAVGLLAAGLVGAAALVLAAPTRPRAGAPYAGRILRPVEWVLPLFVLDLLVVAFVAVQLTVLFGGRDHVLTTAGLTYAQYARQGFGQLVATAVLTLVVVAVAVRVVPRAPRTDRVLQLLLGVLCLLTLVVLASASRRLGLYEQEYGFTRLRISVDAAIGWLAVVLLLVLFAGALRRAAWLPRAVVLSAAAGLLVFAAADPDGRIAARNVERFEATGDVDTAYLSTLSADAVPALLDLPPVVRPCLSVGEDPLAGWNRSRWLARDLLGSAPCR